MSKIDKASNSVFLMDSADFNLVGSDNYQWLGFDALCTSDHTIVVASPGKRTKLGEQAAGAVYGYNLKDKSVRFALESTEDQSKFGSSLSYNKKKNLLAIGAPSRNMGMSYHAGSVFVYDLSSTNLTFSNPKTVFYSRDRGARFGKRVLWVNNEDLVLSAPSYTSYNTMGVPNEQGMVYWYTGASNLDGQYSSLFAAKTFATTEAGCRHGDTLTL